MRKPGYFALLRLLVAKPKPAGAPAPVPSWRDPRPALCADAVVHTGSPLSGGEAP